MGQSTPFGRRDYDHLAITEDEEHRLAILHRTGLLDTAPEPEYDRITRLVANILDVPMAAITLVDRDRQWFKSSIGLKHRQTSRSASFCSHAVALGETLSIADATADARFHDNPYVTGDPNIRFYLGVPLRTSGGAAPARSARSTASPASRAHGKSPSSPISPTSWSSRWNCVLR